MKNVAHLCSRPRSKTWNGEGWKKVVVCIVADGRKKCDPRVLNVLECLGIYQEGVAKNVVNDKPVQAHLYEVKCEAIVCWCIQNLNSKVTVVYHSGVDGS